MSNHYWSEERIEILKNLYPRATIQELLTAFPGKSDKTIRQAAFRLNLKRQRNGDCNTNLDVLLNESHLAYYWIGFLLADGHFGNQLIVQLAIEDIKHLEKLAILVNGTVKIIKQTPNFKIKGKKLSRNTRVARASFADIFNLRKIKEKFGLLSNKTYNSPNIKYFEHLFDNFDLFSCLLIGFIDGDGHISKKGKIKFENHISWINIFEFYSKCISNKFKTSAKPKINSKGMVVYYITKLEIIKFLKEITIKYNLPILERKWNNI